MVILNKRVPLRGGQPRITRRDSEAKVKYDPRWVARGRLEYKVSKEHMYVRRPTPPALDSQPLFLSRRESLVCAKKIVSTTPSAVRRQSFVAGCELRLYSDFYNL